MPEHLLLEVPRPMIEGWTTETFLKNLCASLPAIYQQAAQQNGSVQKYNKMYYDQHVSEQKFEPGDEVMVKNYHHAGPWSANWKGPCTVIDKCGETVYKVQYKAKAGRTTNKWFHVDQLKLYKKPENA